ncbi:hypothetical protein L207DRAFT_79239 [Hyaloscypha variabilis F]|uniref:Uncharacterized protein n=1 Tax=Hyaloscypha variabilis (strain UAMH 11265 / GT02V1 / F) TaxID=1149755 RepID=A0A2J6RGG2_HYAVF|nr:hypothetical protein L207DRAFT_79239 [Hyaloscypha variabilis F]
MQRWTPFLHFNVHTSVFCILPFLFSCLLFTHSPPLHTLHTLRSSSPPGCAHSTQHTAHCTQQRISSSSSPGPPGRHPEPRLQSTGCNEQQQAQRLPPTSHSLVARHLHAQHCIRTSPQTSNLLCVLSRRIRAHPRCLALICPRGDASSFPSCEGESLYQLREPPHSPRCFFTSSLGYPADEPVSCSLLLLRLQDIARHLLLLLPSQLPPR